MANITNKMRYFIATLALLVVSSMAYSQELNLNFSFSNDGAIVRYIDNRQALVYDHSKDKNYFFLVNVNSPTNVQYKKLSDDKLRIYDFEIFDNVVYFCGITNEFIPHALFGYFSIWDFPYGDIYIDTLDYMTSFNKLDVFSVEDQVHVVMTATHKLRFSAMVDVYNVSGHNWQYSIVYSDNRFKGFSDVVATDSLVVFAQLDITTTSLDSVVSSGYTHLWFFPKPLYSGVTLFYNTTNIILNKYDNKRTSLAYLAHRVGDKFDVVCKSGYDKMTIDEFDAIYYLRSSLFKIGTNDRVVDIRYNHVMGCTLVPVAEASGTSVYTTMASVIPGPSPVKYIGYETVQSIDELPGGGRRAVAVGYNSAQDLNFYLIDYALLNSCVPIYDKLPEKIFWVRIPDRGNIVVETDNKDFFKLPYEIDGIHPTIICE